MQMRNFKILLVYKAQHEMQYSDSNSFVISTEAKTKSSHKIKVGNAGMSIASSVVQVCF